MNIETRVTTLTDRYNAMTEAEREALHALHVLLAEIKSRGYEERSFKFDSVQIVEDIEYTLQQIWGFGRDSDFHTHWIGLKDCTCPQIDNGDLFGAPWRITSADCPWHKDIVPF